MKLLHAQILLCAFSGISCFTFFSQQALPFKHPDHDKHLLIPNSIKGNDNESADQMLQIVKSVLKGQDPYVLHNVGPCERCKIYNMQSMMRTGNVTSFETEKEKRINGNFGMEEIHGTCECAIGQVLYGYGKIHFILHNLTFFMDLYSRYEMTEDYADLNTEIMEIIVTHKGTLRAKFEGEGVLGWVVEKVSQIFHNYFIGRIREVIHGKILATIQEYKESLNSL